FFGLVIRDRFGLAETLSADTASVNTLLRNVVSRRVVAALGQGLIISFRSDGVRVAAQINSFVLVLVHERDEAVKNGGGFRLDIALIEIKQHVIQYDRALHFRRRWWWRRRRRRRRRWCWLCGRWRWWWRRRRWSWFWCRWRRRFLRN